MKSHHLFGKRIFILLMAIIISQSFISNAYAQTTLPSIIPLPAKLEMGSGTFYITSTTSIITDEASAVTASQLSDYLAPATGFALKVSTKSNVSKNCIVLKQDASLSRLGTEGYQLTVTPTLIQISATGQAGLFYGVQTLRQLLPTQLFSSKKVKNISWKVPCTIIEDQPRFAWRSFMLDDARRFIGIAELKKYIDEMAELKFNIFQWHFIDNPGWRLEIKSYPLLTSVGAKSGGMITGDISNRPGDLIPSDKDPSQRFYYTQDEAKELIEYAAKKHVRIIPEIEMPGHAAAVLKAYPEWNAGGSLDVTKPEVIEAIKKILDEVITLFPDVIIHTGGDEVRYESWMKAPSIQAAMAAKGLKSAAPLQAEFSVMVSNYLQSKKRRMIIWHDAPLDSVFNDKSIILQFWRGKESILTDAIGLGYDIVNASERYTYLDYNHFVTPISKVYSFDPMPNGVALKDQHHVLGAGFQSWAEYTPTRYRRDLNIFPRIAAMAEVVWTPKERMDFKLFSERLATHTERWSLKGIGFYKKWDKTADELWNAALKGDKIGNWTADKVIKTDKFVYSRRADLDREYDVTPFIKDAGNYNVIFVPTSGVDPFSVRYVELIQNGETISIDWGGIKGGVYKPNNQGYVFELTTDKLLSGAKYILRINCYGVSGTDTGGDIYLIGNK
ncbi:MAG: beta-N-acetylhexosaminidase [Paludibacter sp.]